MLAANRLTEGRKVGRGTRRHGAGGGAAVKLEHEIESLTDSGILAKVGNKLKGAKGGAANDRVDRNIITEGE